MIEIIPLLNFVKDYPWFTPLIAALAILAAITFMTKMVMLSLSNTRSIHNMMSVVLASSKPSKAALKAEQKANDELDFLVKSYGMDRAYIGLFHNGVTSFGGIHRQSMYVKAEGSSGKHPRVTARLSGVPLSIYGSWLYSMDAEREICVDDIRRVQADIPEAYPMFERYSVKSIYILPLINTVTGIDGCAFIEYCSENRTLTSIELDQIRLRTQAIYTKLHEANNV